VNVLSDRLEHLVASVGKKVFRATELYAFGPQKVLAAERRDDASGINDGRAGTIPFSTALRSEVSP
jgi:hypothetical protein